MKTASGNSKHFSFFSQMPIHTNFYLIVEYIFQIYKGLIVRCTTNDNNISSHFRLFRHNEILFYTFFLSDNKMD